jgi:hypothetical protein
MPLSVTFGTHTPQEQGPLQLDSSTVLHRKDVSRGQGVCRTNPEFGRCLPTQNLRGVYVQKAPCFQKDSEVVHKAC